MEDVLKAMWELNIPMLVNHNEVAPSQHELSPIFALTNVRPRSRARGSRARVRAAPSVLSPPVLELSRLTVAPPRLRAPPSSSTPQVSADQNMICMQVMDEIAARHGVKVLQHEKPFAGVNGSGKHSNWGLNTDTGKNLFKPGKTEGSQGDFFAFTAALAYAPPRRRPRRPSDAARRGRRYEAQTPPPARSLLSPLALRNLRNARAKHAGTRSTTTPTCCAARSRARATTTGSARRRRRPRSSRSTRAS